jgi:hypothetical protein
VLLFQLGQYHRAVPILQVSSVQAACLCRNDMLGDPEHFWWQLHFADAAKIIRRVPDLVGKAQYDSAKSPAKRLDNEGTFSSGEHNPTHGDDILCAHRITDDGKRLFSDLAAWRHIIRRMQKGEIDLLERNKPIDLDGAVVFNAGRLRKRRARSGRSVVVRGFSWNGRVVGRDLDFGGRGCGPLARLELGRFVDLSCFPSRN